MIIVDRKTFLGMPIGTVFSKCPDNRVYGIISSIQVLTDVSKCDFNSVDIGCWRPKEGDFADAWSSILDDKNTVEMKLSDRRDGLYDESEMYYVFSKEEIRQMVELFSDALIKLK